jgi:hypothetical protein
MVRFLALVGAMLRNAMRYCYAVFHVYVQQFFFQVSFTVFAQGRRRMSLAVYASASRPVRG